MIHGWVIDDVARFTVKFKVCGNFNEGFSRVHERNFTKLGRGIGQSFLQKNFVSDVRYLAAFSNAVAQN